MMKPVSAPDAFEARLKLFFALAGYLWTILLGGLIVWHYSTVSSEAYELARAETHDLYSKESGFNLWVTMSGGVYLPVTGASLSNTISDSSSERVLSSSSGEKLVYMSAQRINERFHNPADSVIRAQLHVASLDSLQTGNLPDEWEQLALQALQRGDTEVASLDKRNGESYLRLMHPLIVESRCLMCHPADKNRLGALRGGLAASIPWKRYSDRILSDLKTDVLVFGALWIIGILGIVDFRKRLLQTLSKNRQAEDALRESEDNYKRLVEMSPDAIGIYADGLFSFANSRLTELLGATASEDVVGRPVLEHIPLPVPELDRSPGTAAEGGSISVPIVEQKILRLDGTAVDVEVAAIPFLRGGMEFVQVVVRDITARRKAEHRNRLLARTVASITDSVSITDLDDTILFVNDAFVSYYGYTKKEAIGKNISLVRSPLTPPEIGEQIRPATLAGGWVGEIFNRRRDGSDFPMELKTSIVIDDAGSPVALVGVARDITDRKRAEKVTQTLYDMSTAAQSSESLADLFVRIHGQLAGLIQARNFFIALINDAGDSVGFPYDVDENGANTTSVIRLDDAASLTIEVIRIRKSLLLDKEQLEERYASGQNRLWGVAPKCWLGVPLIIGERVIGAMAVQSYDTDLAYGPQDVLLFESASTQIASAIDRKRVADELQKLASVVRFSSELVNLATLDGKMIFLNDAGSRMLGISPEEVEQHNIMQVIPSHLMPKVEAELLPAVMGVGTWEGDLQYLNLKTGRLTDVRAMAFVVRDLATGVPLYLANVSRDITELKRAEEAQHQSELRFRSIWNNSADGMRLTDRAGRIVDVNEAFCKLVKIPREELLGQVLSVAYQNQGPDDTLTPYHKRFDAGELLSTHSGLATLRNGEAIYLDVSSSFIDAVDRERLLLCLFRDVSERKQAEAVVLQEKNFNQAAIDSLPGLFYLIDQEGHFLRWNKNFEILSGYSADEISHMSPLDFFEEAERNIIAERIQSVFLKGEADIEAKFVSKNKSQTPYFLIGELVLFAGKPCLIGTGIDITERKQAEQELRENQELLSLFVRQSPVYTFIKEVTPTESRVLQASDNFEQMTGIPGPKMIGRTMGELFPPEFAAQITADDWAVVSNGTVLKQDEDLNGRHYSTIKFPIVQGTRTLLAGYTIDITERKQAEAYREMGREVLQRLNEPGDLQDSIQLVLAALKTHTGFDAVGIRLQDGDDFPYFVQEGFSKDFLLTENTLIERAADGGVCRDKNGNVRLECTCGLVISGKTDPANPYFTQGGSCWSNDKAGTPFQDTRLHPRDRCLHDGFQSVALVPIRSKDRIVGLIQLNDRREGRLTLDTVEILEGIAAHIGAALMRKQAEGELNKSRQDFKKLFDDAPVGYHEIDAEGRIVRMNATELKMLGYSIEELLGRPVWELSADPERSHQAVLAKLAGTLVPDQPYERIISRKDGSTIPVLVEDRVSKREDGTVIGIRTNLQDISARKLVEDILQQSEERFRLVAASAQDGIIVINDEGIVTYWNRAAEEMFGYTQEEAEGRNAHSLFMPERYRSDFEKGFQGFRTEGTGTILGRRVEVSARKKDGTEFIAEISISSLNIKGRRHALGLIRDITESKNAQEHLARYTEELYEAKSNMEEQAQLLQLQANDLREAHEVAMEASRLKSEFVANMSHEIRTPMNGVIGMTDLLMETKLTEEQREYAEVIHKSGDALLGVINDILDFSKIESGKMTCEAVDFDLRATAEAATSVNALRAQQKGLEIMCFVHQDVPLALKGDEGKVRQILVNLMGNSIKFTEKGEIEVRAILEEEAGDRVVIRFSVKDSGIGISEDQQQRIFQSFVQADGSITRKFGGTGLGLSISKRLVELMGGTIGLESREGQGSTFWFTLPFAKGQARPIVEHDGMSGLRVLVVDDCATNRTIIRLMLEAWGIKVESLDSGRRALQVLRDAGAEERFDIAILDMQMPEMDGLELAQHIKADPEIAMTRLIMLSSMGHTRSTPHVERGIEAVLTKPVRQSNLYDTLAQLLSTGRAPTETAAAQIDTNGSDMPGQQNEAFNVRVLVAEDNQVNQEIASRMLEKLGCKVDIANDGAEAIRLVQEKDYDAVFMDCFMPVVDGYNATKAIRSREAPGMHVTIVAMTANALEGDRERCLAAGMDEYITKPVKLETLKATLRKWVGAKKYQPVNDTIADRESEEKQCPTLDRERLRTLKELGDEGDPTWLRTIVDIFVKDTAQRLTDITLILDARDKPGLVTLAHTLKGSCRNMGALGMTRLCQDIEGALEKGIIEPCRTIIDDLKNEFVEVRDALGREVSQ